VNNSKFDTDGFAMLHDFLTQINHNTSTNKLRTLKTFANLSFPANMEGTEFLSIGRGLAYNMHGFNSYELVAMKMIKCFQEDGRYEGIVKSYLQGDLTSCDLDQLGILMDAEDDCNRLLSPPPPPPPFPSPTRPAGSKRTSQLMLLQLLLLK
jgi:hypothetical protein